MRRVEPAPMIRSIHVGIAVGLLALLPNLAYTLDRGMYLSGLASAICVGLIVASLLVLFTSEAEGSGMEGSGSTA